jgi:bifunctional DNA-binding transcriptional regulator/antitoxin component of YhaV-PrlF toxin-antitoxin module
VTPRTKRSAAAKNAAGVVKRFTYKLEGEGKNRNLTAIRPPFDVKTVFGKMRVPVCGTIDGCPYRTTIAPMGGEYYMVVSKALRDAAGINIGDTVEVTMQLDTAERTVELPADLAALLKRTPKAQERFDSSSYTHRKEFARWITSAKRPETRESRLKRTIEMLLKKQHL